MIKIGLVRKPVGFTVNFGGFMLTQFSGIVP
jgi:hypothetical protein